MYNSAKRTLTLKDINDFIRFWHRVKQPYCILTLSSSWHERFCFVLYLWEGRNNRYKATKNRKILMTTVPTGGLFEYTRRSIFVSVSVPPTEFTATHFERESLWRAVCEWISLGMLNLILHRGTLYFERISLWHAVVRTNFTRDAANLIYVTGHIVAAGVSVSSITPSCMLWN
jgi:hypothetical protein